jgi:drug/metabolite transporter (DMT)-like permease
MQYFGHIAALATSVAWSCTSVMFTLSGKKIGSVISNQLRLIFATILATLTHFIIFQSFIPMNAGINRWMWLALSGVFGYVVSDGLLFQSFVYIGPRLSMLMFSTSPIFSTLMAWLFFHETLSTQEVVAILVVILGVGCVVMDRQNHVEGSKPTTGREFRVGLLLGLLAALGQSVGLIFSKIGLQGDFPALSGNVVRLLAAAVVMWLPVIFGGKIIQMMRTIQENATALWIVAGGSFSGPFLGVWLSLIAIQNAPMGIASTLMGLAPIALLPISWVLFKERFGWLAIAGTMIAVIGTAMFFL